MAQVAQDTRTRHQRVVNLRGAIKGVVLVVLTLGVTAAQDDATDAARLVEVLRIHRGSAVADIGAGGGVLTIPIADRVGPTGHVYATELGGSSLEQLRKALARAGATNVDVVEGDANRTNLPVECCDAIIMRFVYHHFADPAAMNASLRQSLKPGGRLAVMDFAPDGPEANSPGDRCCGKTHGVAAGTVERELQQAGFERVLTEQRYKRTFLVVARRPEVGQTASTRRRRVVSQLPTDDKYLDRGRLSGLCAVGWPAGRPDGGVPQALLVSALFRLKH